MQGAHHTEFGWGRGAQGARPDRDHGVEPDVQGARPPFDESITGKSRLPRLVATKNAATPGFELGRGLFDRPVVGSHNKDRGRAGRTLPGDDAPTERRQSDRHLRRDRAHEASVHDGSHLATYTGSTPTQLGTYQPWCAWQALTCPQGRLCFRFQGRFHYAL